MFCHCNLQLLEKATLSPEPMQVNVDKIDIERVHNIPDIPPEEHYIYSMLYEELSIPSHDTRGQRRSRVRTAHREREPKPDASSSSLSAYHLREVVILFVGLHLH